MFEPLDITAGRHTDPLHSQSTIVMNGSLANEIDSFTQITETKRIYFTIENLLSRSSPACVVVTSSMPAEGKTTVAATLAGIAAHQGQFRVLAADLNWYTPSLHRCFGLDLTFDADAINGHKQVTELVRSSGMKGLDILTAANGAGDGAEPKVEPSLLGTKIMEQARQAYDLIIVDTASISKTNRLMMDPVSLSKSADGTVLVVLANVTPRQRAKHAHILLETAGANVLGVIVNQWKNPLT